MSKDLFSRVSRGISAKEKTARTLVSFSPLLLAGCAAEEPKSSMDDVVERTRQLFDPNYALEKAREGEIERENLQIALSFGILVALIVVVALLVLSNKKKAAPCGRCGRNLWVSNFCSNCGTALLETSRPAKFSREALTDSPSIATLAQTKSSGSAVFLSFWLSLKSLRFDRKMFWISVSMCFILLAVYLPVVLSFFGL